MSITYRPNGFTAYGIDGCRNGWFVVALGQQAESPEWWVSTSIASVVEAAGEV